MPTIPTEALPLLKSNYAACHTETFSTWIAQHSRGALIAVQCGREYLLVPVEAWAAAEADVAGIRAEVEALEG